MGGGLALFALALGHRSSSPNFFALDALTDSVPPPAPQLELAPTKGCDDWPSSELNEFLEMLNVDVGTLGWRCIGGEYSDTLHRSRQDVKAGKVITRDACKAWCLAAHPSYESRRAHAFGDAARVDTFGRRALHGEATNLSDAHVSPFAHPLEAHNKTDAGDSRQGWCCQWRAERGGECTWSDGVPRLTQAKCTYLDGKGKGPCLKPLAFGLCSLAHRFRLFGGGRCLEDKDVVIGHVEAASVEQCSIACDHHAHFAKPKDPRCRAFGYRTKPMSGPHRRRTPPTKCVLLDYCKVRPSKVYTFYARPEAIPPLPALT